MQSNEYWFGLPKKLLWGFVAIAIFMAGDGFEMAFLSKHITDMGFSPAQSAVVFTIYGLAAALAAWASGVVAELITPQRAMTIGCVLWVIMHALFMSMGLGMRNYPLMHDFCHISLSDLLTPWPVIEKRIVAAGEADFVICFYNPRSRGREGHLARAFTLLAASKSADTPVGVVKSAGRKKQEKWLTTLGEMDFAPVDMTSLVIVGNKATYIDNGLMITPRGYAL